MPNTKTTNNQTAKSHLISKNFSLNLFLSTCQRKNCTKITEAVASVASMDQNLPFEQTHFFLTSVKMWNDTTRGVLARLEGSTKSSAITEGPRTASCQLKSCQLPRNSAETILVRQVLNKSKLWSWRVTVGQCVINMCTQTWRDRVAFIVL